MEYNVCSIWRYLENNVWKLAFLVNERDRMVDFSECIFIVENDNRTIIDPIVHRHFRTFQHIEQIVDEATIETIRYGHPETCSVRLGSNEHDWFTDGYLSLLVAVYVSALGADWAHEALTIHRQDRNRVDRYQLAIDAVAKGIRESNVDAAKIAAFAKECVR